MITGLGELAGGIFTRPADPGKSKFVRSRPIGSVESDNLRDRGVADTADLRQDDPS
jgi:hypothetical protein